MNDETIPEWDLTTELDVRGTGFTTEEFTTGSDPAREIDPRMKKLLDHYHAILDDRAIYYPVAYRFIKELGRGRQGVVFLGHRQGARGSVTSHAIKVFDPGIYPSVEKYWTDMGRIAVQTSRLQTVKSPNLVAPDVYEEFNGIGYVQMESINGVGLRYLLNGEHLERVRQNSTPEEWSSFSDVIFRIAEGKVAIQPGVVIYIMRRVLRALEALHKTGYVHCDVKPANIMIDKLGYVKLIDYGRATLENEKVTYLLGTPIYMPPEMHRREPSTAQSDLYTVGMVIMEMLRGEPVITRGGLSEKELLEAKLDIHNRLHELLPEHVLQNEFFVDVLRRFLDPDPSARYANAQEAESGQEGLLTVHRQLAQAGKDTEYGRELENYLSKLENPLTGNLET